MKVIDIKCQDSINSSLNCCHLEGPKDPLHPGRYNQIYLFFNLPAFLEPRQIDCAKLILYKAPPFGRRDENAQCEENRYYLFPLLDYFSVYSCKFCKPAIDTCRRVVFYNDYCKSYTEIDITSIVKDWLDFNIENKGLLLVGSGHSECVFYESNRSDFVGMRPTLRLFCSGISPFPTPTLACADCDVVINRPS